MPGNKSLPLDMAKHFRQELLAVIDRDFVGTDGKTLPERAIEKRLRISQPVINAVRNWRPDVDKKQPPIGIHALIALSEYTHKSIDALLGRELPLPVQQRQDQLDAIVAKAEEMTRLLDKNSTFAFGPKSKIGKLRDEIQRLALAARQQKALDERVRLVNEMPVPVSPRKAG